MATKWITTKVDLVWRGEEIKIQAKKMTYKSIYEVGLAVEGKAKLLSAKNWGYLAASITTQSEDGRGTVPEPPSKFKQATPYGKPLNANVLDLTIAPPTEKLQVYVGTPVYYSWYVEYGTYKMNAQPFLRPALDLVKGKVLTIVKENSKYYFKEYAR
jgi:HK97 gp10 family phage protein